MNRKQRLEFLNALLEQTEKQYLQSEVEHRTMQSLMMSSGKKIPDEVSAASAKAKRTKEALAVKSRQVKAVMHDIDNLEI